MAALQECEIDTTQRNVLVAHQFVTGADRSDSEETSVGGLDNVSAEVFKDFDYVHWDISTDLRRWGERLYATVGRRLSILSQKQIIKSR